LTFLLRHLPVAEAMGAETNEVEARVGATEEDGKEELGDDEDTGGEEGPEPVVVEVGEAEEESDAEGALEAESPPNTAGPGIVKGALLVQISGNSLLE